MYGLALLVVLLLSTSCTLPIVIGDTSLEAPMVSQPEPGPVSVPAQVVLTPLTLVQPAPQVVEIPQETLPSLLRPVALAAPPRRAVPAPRPLSPLQLVEEGQQAARIGPGSPGYRHVGAMHFYQYEMGVVFDLYVSPSLATGLLFPVGDAIKVGLFLPKDDFDVETKSAGEGLQAYDALTIHPKVTTGTYDAFVLMANGRVYPFHIIVGKKGMLTVSFDLPVLEAQR